MAKLPFMKFFPKDWLFDTRILTHYEKSVLIDLICFMWDQPERGVLIGRPEDLGRMVGMEWGEMEVAINGLKNKKVINVTEDNGEVTLVSRRIIREEKERESNNIRQSRFRNTHSVTPIKRKVTGRSHITEVRSHITDKIDIDKKSNLGRDGKVDFNKTSQDYKHGFELLWKQYPKKLGKAEAWFQFKKQIDSKEELALIWKAVTNYNASRRVKDGFTMDGGKWFTGAWRDWIEYTEPTKESKEQKEIKRMEESHARANEIRGRSKSHRR